MDSREVRDLMEAYLDVYASEEDDFANWVDALLDEGYDLSDYTWDEVYEAYTELLEANSGYNMDKINKDPLAAMTPATFLKPKEPGQQFASPRRKGPGGGRIPSSLAPSRTAAAVADIIKGKDRNVSRSRSLPKEPKTTKMVKKDGKWVKEAFDIVLAHLVSEGYADNFDSAKKIMVNMSEEWIHSIVDEGKKPLPVSKMAKQARRIAFSAGVEDASDEGTAGYVPHSNPENALKKMSKIGGSKVKHHAKKGYEMGTEHDPYYGLGKK